MRRSPVPGSAYNGALLDHGALDAELRELLILAVVGRLDSDLVWRGKDGQLPLLGGGDPYRRRQVDAHAIVVAVQPSSADPPPTQVAGLRQHRRTGCRAVEGVPAPLNRATIVIETSARRPAASVRLGAGRPPRCVPWGGPPPLSAYPMLITE